MQLRFFRIVPVLIAASLALGVSALAAPAPTPGVETTPIPTNAKPDWSSMKFNLGSWTCVSRSSRRSAPFTSTASTSMDMTGYWMITKTHTAALSWAPEVDSVDQITYDPIQHRWVDVYTDNGGNYDVSFSPGWKGNTMVWTDALFAPGPDIIAASPATLTKVSDTKTTTHSTFTEKSGNVRTLDVTCTKG
jgi:hypothetical protein